MSQTKVRVAPSGREARIDTEPASRNVYQGTWVTTGKPMLAIWSGGKWIEHPYDVDCPDCRAVRP